MIKSYSCTYCPFKSTRIYNFKRHCRAVHKTVVEDQQSDTGQNRHVTYQCPDCQYMTKRVNDLKRHLKVMHNMKIKHPQNLTSQIDTENTNIQNQNKGCHKETCKKRKPVVITSKGASIIE